MSIPRDEALADLRVTLTMMFSLADRNFDMALRALQNQDQTLALGALAEDSQVDQLEIEVDEKIVLHIATKAPVARDCRLMLVASKIAGNLERISDQAAAISKQTLHLIKEARGPVPTEITEMGILAQEMIRKAISSFVESQPGLAPGIIAADAAIDALHKQTTTLLLERMNDNQTLVNEGVALILAARAIERAADHAKNIAEEVFFLFEAIDIRHPRRR